MPKIIRSVDQFARIRRIFQEKTSESGGMPLDPVKPTDTIIGELGRMAILFDSQVGCFTKLAEERLKDGMTLTETEKDMFDVVRDCLWEAVYTEYPEAMKHTRVKIRQGWILVAEEDSYTIPGPRFFNLTMDEFFPDLKEILEGGTVYSNPTIKSESDCQGTIVGTVTEPVLKQLCVHYDKVNSEFFEWINESEDSIFLRFGPLPTWRFIEHKQCVRRMDDQQEIIQQIFKEGIFYQGFDQDYYNSLIEIGKYPWLHVNSDWNIVIPK